MDGIEHLRLAAERLSPTWADAPDPCPGCRGCRIDKATADLLRAVALVHESQEGEPDDGPCGCPDLGAALALADVVLSERARVHRGEPPVGAACRACAGTGYIDQAGSTTRTSTVSADTTTRMRLECWACRGTGRK